MRKSKVLLAVLAFWLLSGGQLNAQPILEVVEFRYSPSVPAPGWTVVGDIFTASLDVRVENTGADDAFNAIATLTGVAAGVTILDGDVIFGNVPGGGTTWSVDAFSYSLDLTSVPSDLSTSWDVEFDAASGTRFVVRGVPGPDLFIERSQVPEAVTLALMSIGFAGIGFARKKKQA